MHRNPEPIGTRFGRWTITGYAGTNKYKMRLVEARCDCGNQSTVILANMRAGSSTQCRACGRAEMAKARKAVRRADWVPPTTKLTRDHVREIKRRLKFERVSNRQLARDYQVHTITITRIRDGLCWADVPWPETNEFPAE